MRVIFTRISTVPITPVGILILMAAIFFFILAMLCCGESWKLLMFYLIISAFLFCTVIYFKTDGIGGYQVKEYGVLLDDNVTAKEFLDKYECVDVLGDIYICRDKETKDE